MEVIDMNDELVFNQKVFQNKVVLVTGSSRGIGREIALAFARHGANVIVNNVVNDVTAKEVVKECETEGSRALMVKADVSKPEDVEQLFNLIVNEFGRLDILVNNAGITADKTILKMSYDMWEKVLNVNLGGVFNCCKQAISIMSKQQYGRIISISSIVAQTGNFGQVNYSASKAGIIGLTKSLALEAIRFNVTVNAIAPGFVDTDMVRVIPSDRLQEIVNKIPMKRLANPAEIAYVALFLASDAASYVTGQVINVNGGLY